MTEPNARYMTGMPGGSNTHLPRVPTLKTSSTHTRHGAQNGKPWHACGVGRSSSDHSIVKWDWKT